MDGRVQIVNMALLHLGEGLIQDLTEGSTASRVASACYDMTRKAVLRDFNWSFALGMKKLARLEEREEDFLYSYALPADCIRAIRLRGRGVPDFMETEFIRFAVRGRRVCTDDPSPLLEYLRDVTDPIEFDDKFIEAFAYKLASDMAMPIKAGAQAKADMLAVYKGVVNEAATLSANECKDELPDNPYVEAYFNGGR